jgi:uncharacterized repeat protein (TIGR03803 family)
LVLFFKKEHSSLSGYFARDCGVARTGLASQKIRQRNTGSSDMPTARLLAAATVAALLTSFPARAQSFTALYAFRSGDDGALPLGGLVYSQGFLYGTTNVGGSLRCSGTGCGTAFQVNATTGAERVLHRFLTGHGGVYVSGGLTQIGGTLYGTAENGGADSAGVVFQLDPSTHSTTVLDRLRAKRDGAYPMGGVVAASSLLYGTAFSGGATGQGTIFQVDPATGKASAVYSFKAFADGAKPLAGLAYHAGVLYGTTSAGGAAGCTQNGGCGTVFKFDLSTGTETVLHAFTGGADGSYPAASMMYRNGTLYGTTAGGGSTSCTNGCGTLFSMDPNSGTETVLHSFTNGADGGYPYAGVLYQNGMLYGTTLEGGGTNCGRCFGTVYGLNITTGTETVLYSFTGGTDGAYPEGPLTANAGVIYGTTTQGGVGSYGTVFAVKP